MAKHIVEAKLDDIQQIEQLAYLSFKKFGLDKMFSYDPQSVKNNLQEMIKNNSYYVFVFKNINIMGFIISAVSPTLYNHKSKQIVEICLQADPKLTKQKQAKILLALIKKQESIAKKKQIRHIALSICPQFDLSSHLKKRNYKITDQIYYKENVWLPSQQ